MIFGSDMVPKPFEFWVTPAWLILPLPKSDYRKRERIRTQGVELRKLQYIPDITNHRFQYIHTFHPPSPCIIHILAVLKLIVPWHNKDFCKTLQREKLLEYKVRRCFSLYLLCIDTASAMSLTISLIPTECIRRMTEYFSNVRKTTFITGYFTILQVAYMNNELEIHPFLIQVP